MFSSNFFTTSTNNSFYCVPVYYYMALFKYFKVCKDHCVPPLPDLIGLLSEVIDHGVIEAANEEVMALLKDGKGVNTKHSPYLKIIY